MSGEDRTKEVEDRIAGLKGRWPAHSVPPSIWRELEALEEELEEARKAGGGTDPAQDGTRQF